MEEKYTTINVPDVGEVPIDTYIDVVWSKYFEPYVNVRGRILGEFQIKRREISDVTYFYKSHHYVTKGEIEYLKGFLMYFDMDLYNKIKEQRNG